MGYWAQLTGKPLPGWSLHVGYSAEDPDQGQEKAAPLFFRNSSIWVSTFYKFFGQMTLGFQWQQIRSEDITINKAPRKNLTGNSFMGNAKLEF